MGLIEPSVLDREAKWKTMTLPYWLKSSKTQYQNRRKRQNRYLQHTNTWSLTFLAWYRHFHKKSGVVKLVLWTKVNGLHRAISSISWNNHVLKHNQYLLGHNPCTNINKLNTYRGSLLRFVSLQRKGYDVENSGPGLALWGGVKPVHGIITTTLLITGS